MPLSKPNIVKGIPVPLIRPLPTLYYYSRYANGKNSTKASGYFYETIQYFDEALSYLNSHIENSQLGTIRESVSKLTASAGDDRLQQVIHITNNLSACCTQNSTAIKKNPNLAKQNFCEIYNSKVKPLKVLLVNNNQDEQRLAKFSDTFNTTCFYDAIPATRDESDYWDNLNDTDFVVFTSAFPMSINEDVRNIQNRQKPLIVLAEISKDNTKDQQTLRNGAWLQNSGFEVLYKIFTPLRLFTTIDKIFMKHHLT